MIIPLRVRDHVAQAKLSILWALTVALITSTLVLNSAHASNVPDGTTDLKNSVMKLAVWLDPSDQRDGWRKYLLLDKLETQAALGNQADLGVLLEVQSRFYSNASGLSHPVFVDVRNSLDNQVRRLSDSRQKSIPMMISEAKYSYTTPSVALMYQHRDKVITDIDFLISHYRSKMSSKERADLFYDLKLDPIKTYLRGLKIELAPEVSVSKLDSMIRVVQSDLDNVVEKIDAMPILPGPDENEDDVDDIEAEDESPPVPQPDNGPESLNLSAPRSDLAGQILIGDRPSEDNGEPTLEELEIKRKLLEAKKDTLKDRRKVVRKADLPRLRERSKTLRQLRKYELIFEEFAQEYGDPYFVIAQASLVKFSRSYLHGTSGNLQEDMLKRITEVEKNLLDLHNPEEARAASGELGDALRWLEGAGLSPSLVTAIRSKYSHPNAYLSIQGSMLNDLIGQMISERTPIRQTAFGRLVRGCAETNGNVWLQLIHDPNQIQAQLLLSASVATDAYVEQGRIKVFTNSNGMLSGDRRVAVGLGGVDWSDAQINADFSSSFAGTSSRLRLVNRIANKAFNKNKSEADALAERQAREKGLQQFNEQTEKPLIEANEGLLRLRENALKKSNVLPSVTVNSISDSVNVVIKKETDATLAAATKPGYFGVNPQVRLRIHDTLLSNYLDPFFRGKTFTNEELADLISGITGNYPEGLTGENDEGEPAKEFSISFARVRPIQIEFENQKIRVVVSGRKFAQGGKEIDAGLKIILNFKVTDELGQLKFGRDGKVEFEFLDPDRTTPALVAFRRFLDESLNDSLENDATATDLPKNFIPLKEIPKLADRPLAKNLRLTQFRSENGWLYFGWNLETNPGDSYGWIYDLPAIWRQ